MLYMSDDLYKNIVNSSAHRKSRDAIAQLILAQENLFPLLLTLALNTQDKNHHKACWIMELVLQENLNLIADYLSMFCDNLKKYKNESALRSISKICMFLSKHQVLTSVQEQQIIESCLDWLITDITKVATKAYSVRALYEIGKKQDWIYPELHRILTDDYHKHSYAYKAVAREILKKFTV